MTKADLNALTDAWHPTQSLADVLTMTEHHGGDLQDIAFCFTGDGCGDIARSLLVTGALLGMHVRLAAPAGRQPPPGVVAAAEAAARSSGARILVTEDLDTAVRGADFVYTDVWVSMGEPDEAWPQRVSSLLPYRVTDEVLDATNRSGVRFMHCLPAIHNRGIAIGARLHRQFGLDGAEVTEEVFESKRSIVFDQAENRMHVIKALLVRALAVWPRWASTRWAWIRRPTPCPRTGNCVPARGCGRSATSRGWDRSRTSRCTRPRSWSGTAWVDRGPTPTTERAC
ncbi:hypothetical protein [Micromonospora endophytica]|uniref:hypothetical protein n=1 Tax=Micromonospora endophytica TaxID=515350 RepID=UPI001BB42C53|nr:hypothetical protein [Micromonospora endophytica]BCJ61773.1 hypothetical protein Jiend_51950 [Micromonospora endophytica]